MFPFRWFFFVCFVLNLASLVSSLPLPQAITLRGRDVDVRDVSVGGRVEKRQWRTVWDPEHVDETYITLINATPYGWHRGYIHQYQMPDWKEDFPRLIHPGESISVLIQPRKVSGNWDDSAAEVVYHLAGTSEPMSFMVKFNNRGSSFLKVEFREALSSMNNAKGSVHQFEITKFPGGGSAFIIAGEEGDFITNDPPIDWMQSMLPELKDKPLRELVLGMSHHSGLWLDYVDIGLASAQNTQTQSVHLREQLGNGGIRVIDFRPLKVGDDFRETHGVAMKDPVSGIMFQGSEGASLSEMIETVNEFNRKYPGELIIWEVHGDDAWNKDYQYRKLMYHQEDRMALYNQFLALENRVDIPDHIDDISECTLGQFIGNKRSAVLVKFDERWRLNDLDVFPGRHQGFVSQRLLPLTHPWSNTNNIHELASNQVAHFQTERPTPQNAITVADWALTLRGIQFARDSILQLSAVAWRSLFEDLWPATTSDSYPNWISVDNVRGNQHKTLVMAMNHCLVAKKCGDLSGKVST